MRHSFVADEIWGFMLEPARLYVYIIYKYIDIHVKCVGIRTNTNFRRPSVHASYVLMYINMAVSYTHLTLPTICSV